MEVPVFVSASQILARLLTVDANDSGLNANKLQGYVAADFAAAAHTHSYQPIDAELTAIAGLTSAANTVPSFTGSGTAALLTVGTGANNLVQLTAASKLPAVDGSLLTNLPAPSGVLLATGETTGATSQAQSFSNPVNINAGVVGTPALKITAPTFPHIDLYSSDANANTRNWRITGLYNDYGQFEIMRSTVAGGAPTTTVLAINKDGRVGIAGNPNALYNLAVTGSIYSSTNVGAGNSFFFPNSDLLMYASAGVGTTGNAYTFADGTGANLRQIKAASIQSAKIQPAANSTNAVGFYAANGTTQHAWYDSTNGRFSIGEAANSSMFNVGGTIQADGLRLDVTPTAETPSMTHTITISVNGTNYKVPCVAA